MRQREAALQLRMQRMQVQEKPPEATEHEEQVSEHESDDDDDDGAPAGASLPMECILPTSTPLRGAAIRGIKAGGVKPTTAASSSGGGCAPSASPSPSSPSPAAPSPSRALPRSQVQQVPPPRGRPVHQLTDMDTDDPSTSEGGARGTECAGAEGAQGAEVMRGQSSCEALTRGELSEELEERQQMLVEVRGHAMTV